MLQLEYGYNQETWKLGEKFPTLGKRFDLSDNTVVQIDGEELDLVGNLWPGDRPIWPHTGPAPTMILYGAAAKFAVANLKLYIDWLAGQPSTT